MSSAAVDFKEAATRQARERLREFLAAGAVLSLPRPHRPRLSVLLVLYNRAELTLSCLRTLAPKLGALDAEVVLVDNASRDETAALLDRVRGATVLRNADNRGYPRAVNQAAGAAAGDYLLMLNNDTEVLGDSLAAAVHFLESHADVGAAGGRIILLDGMLQEAGCTVWREGHVLQYGRGDTPSAPEYQFRRDVDYCSGAFLMTPRRLFRKLSGFDEAFSPGYFEDVDYCVRLWRAGWRVAYLPDVALVHYENASSTSRQDLLALYRRNHVLFTRKHADWLAWQCSSAHTPRLWARSSHDDRFRVLYLPASPDGAAAAVEELRTLNCFVTVYPVGPAAGRGREEMGVPDDVELMPGGGAETLPHFLAARRGYYDCVVSADPDVLQRVRDCQNRTPRAA